MSYYSHGNLSITKGSSFFKGDPSEAMYIILNGKLNLVREDKPLLKLAKNQLIGEISMVVGRSRSATATASTMLIYLNYQRKTLNFSGKVSFD